MTDNINKPIKSIELTSFFFPQSFQKFLSVSSFKPAALDLSNTVSAYSRTFTDSGMKFFNARRSFTALYFLLVFGFFLLAVFFFVSTWENNLFKIAQNKSHRTHLLVESGLLDALTRLDNDPSLPLTKFDLMAENHRRLLNLTNPGDMGAAVVLPEKLPDEVKKLIEKGWKDYTINQFVSDLVPLRRSLPDIRGDYCKQQTYRNLPKASVIIIFHNEAWSMVKIFLNHIQLFKFPL